VSILRGTSSLNRLPRLLVSLTAVLLTVISEGVPSPQFAEKDPSKPMDRLPDHKRSWEVGWGTDWKLVRLKEDEINHFASGYVMTWERYEGTRRRVRTDGFTLDWKFWWGHEEVFEEEKLIARGPIYINANGRPLWRSMVSLGNVYPDNPMKDELLWYGLEMFNEGKVVCEYRSKVNFGINPTTLRLERVPDDTQLIAGEKCPSVQELPAIEY
jgi:hypothetical protein